MGRLLEIVTPLHKKTKRDYAARMRDDKSGSMTVAKKFDKDFWDGERKYGYGGYSYDGRWEPVARKLIEIYDLKPGARILDVGCGKGFLLYEFKKLLPQCTIAGFDISSYAIAQAKDEVKSSVFVYNAQEPYPFADKEFDLVVSITTLHNLPIYGLKKALSEIGRVGKQAYILVESFRNDREQFNLQCWVLTCLAFFSVKEWVWLFEVFGYSGDYEFI
ncbi:MAG: class I SAM-dependent methyltransferase [Candidatus Omnitrophica bacterium]|nr:class I SAM-dependent methyltransferase [Candidatus Omnitrophota bacterium]